MVMLAPQPLPDDPAAATALLANTLAQLRAGGPVSRDAALGAFRGASEQGVGDPVQCARGRPAELGGGDDDRRQQSDGAARSGDERADDLADDLAPVASVHGEAQHVDVRANVRPHPRLAEDVSALEEAPCLVGCSRAAGGAGGATGCRSSPVTVSTRLVIAVAALVPEAVSPMPATTTADTIWLPTANCRPDARFCLSILNLPFRSSMV